MHQKYITYLQEGEVSRTDTSYLHTIARLCSDKYGDPIHLARAMVSSFSTEYFDMYDDCLFTTPPANENDPRSLNSGRFSFAAFPNPVTDRLSISFFEETNATMILYDVAGMIVQQWSVTGSKEHYKVLQIPAGVYFLKVTTDEGFSDYQKIIVI